MWMAIRSPISITILEINFTPDRLGFNNLQQDRFSRANFFFCLRIEYTKKGTKKYIRRRACSQKGDVSHTNSSMYFFL